MKPRMGARAWLASKFKEDPTSVPKIVSEFCSYTTLTGLGRIVDSTTITRKAFWILLCLAAYAMCTWHCHTLFMQFFERPTVTVLTVKHAPVRLNEHEDHRKTTRGGGWGTPLVGCTCRECLFEIWKFFIIVAKRRKRKLNTNLKLKTCIDLHRLASTCMVLHMHLIKVLVFPNALQH